MYQIKAHYFTGDTFQSEDTYTILDLVWANLDNAKANLQRIKDHYDQYQEIESSRSYYSRDKKRKVMDILEDNSTKDWFVKQEKLAAILKSNDSDTTMYITEKDVAAHEKAGHEVKMVCDRMMAQNCILLYTDDGNPYQMWAPWCGYFEGLYYAEIVSKGNTDMKISF